MNSLIKKGISIILVLLFVTAAFSGCGANGAKAISAPVRPLGVQAPQNGIQLLTSDDTAPEATEPEATEPETTEPEATEPEATEPEATEPEATEPEATEPSTEAPVAGGFFQEFWVHFLEFFEWFRIRVNYVFDVLMKQ